MNALVLGGGGAKGAYQIGAWRALDELNQSFEIVTGTSIGALNAALYVQNDYEVAQKLWSEMTIDQMIKADGNILERLVNYDVDGKDFKQVFELFAKTISQSGLDITPLREIVANYIDESAVRKSRIKLGIVTFSLTDFKPLELSIDQIPEGQLHDYLIASASLPVFKLERKFGKLMIDGGFYDNLPINMLIRENDVDKVYVIRLNAHGVVRDYSMHNHLVVFEPSEDLGGLLNINKNLIQKNIKK